jgi:SAM-dependent methyltransferase
MMRLITRLFDRPAVYKGFHRIFSGEKFEYLSQYLQERRFPGIARVLDLGCGPGSAAGLFLDRGKYDYLGVDMNPRYIEKARIAYPEARFMCADITTLRQRGQQYDIVIINSVMHHLNDSEAAEVLSTARELLTDDGDCVVLDMIRPLRPGLNTIQRLLIFLDRGAFCRSLSQLEAVLRRYFVLSRTFSFSVDRCGMRLWDLRLFICRRP